MSVNEKKVKIANAIVILAVIAVPLCYVLVDVVRRHHSREQCVAVLYEDCIRCDNGVDHYRQTVKIESPDDVERLELAPYVGGRMFVHITDNCRLPDEILARLHDWATTNGLAEVSIIRNYATLRGKDNPTAGNVNPVNETPTERSSP